MTKIPSNEEPTQIWNQFLDIQRVLEKRYQNDTRVRYAVAPALQRLGEAILLRYDLNKFQHPMTRPLMMKIKPDREIDLSSREKMLAARIMEWEEAIPSEQAGHDVWTEGRPEGYALKPSLQQSLDMPYAEIKLIVDMRPEQVIQLLQNIKQNVATEVARLQQKGGADQKILEINKALDLLEAAVVYKYKMTATNPLQLDRKQKDTVDKMDLYSYETMLKALIGERSLNQALNLSTGSWMSQMFGLQEALWGQADALTNLQKSLHLSPTPRVSPDMEKDNNCWI